VITAFDYDVADIIWIKMKGMLVPEHFTDDDRRAILKRYWHAAMENETYVNLDAFRESVSRNGKGR
jgi:hypothetical protein